MPTTHRRQDQSSARREERQDVPAESRAAGQVDAVVPGMRLRCNRVALVENEVRDLQRDDVDGAQTLPDLPPRGRPESSQIVALGLGERVCREAAVGPLPRILDEPRAESQTRAHRAGRLVGAELCQVVDGLEKAAPPLDPQSATMLDHPPAERFIPLTAFRLTQYRQG